LFALFLNYTYKVVFIITPTIAPDDCILSFSLKCYYIIGRERYTLSVSEIGIRELYYNGHTVNNNKFWISSIQKCCCVSRNNFRLKNKNILLRDACHLDSQWLCIKIIKDFFFSLHKEKIISITLERNITNPCHCTV